MPLRIWRAIHYLSFPLFAVVQLHILLAGTDRSSPWVLGAIVACDAVIAGLLVRRGLIEEAAAEREAEPADPPGRHIARVGQAMATRSSSSSVQ